MMRIFTIAQNYLDELNELEQEESEVAFQDVLNQLVNKSDEERKQRQEKTEDEMYDIQYDYFDIASESLRNILEEFINMPEGSKQPWTLIPFNRIHKIWNDAAKEGFVRDAKGIDAIAQQMIETTLKLAANTLLLGHTQSSPTEEYEEYGIDDEGQGRFADYAVDDNGQYRLSDYGMRPLEEFAFQLYSQAHTPEDQMLIIDKMLNVVHQRSNLASWYIEGGFTSLNELAGNPMSNFDHKASTFNWYKLATS
jgi:hypothetical protein